MPRPYNPDKFIEPASVPVYDLYDAASDLPAEDDRSGSIDRGSASYSRRTIRDYPYMDRLMEVILARLNEEPRRSTKREYPKLKDLPPPKALEAGEDIYDALMGEIPTDEPSQKLMANALRRRRDFGELASITGDKVLQPFGKSLMEGADDYAKTIAETRLADVDNRQNRRNQDASLEYNYDLLAENALGNQQKYELEALKALDDWERAQRAGSGAYRPLTVHAQKKLDAFATEMGQMNDLQNFIESGRGYGAVEVAGIPVPFLRQGLNVAAEFGLGTKDTLAANQARKQFDRFYNLSARYNLFGATLTRAEERAWEMANPSTRQTDKQIHDALSAMKKIMAAQKRRFARGLEADRYDPIAIAEHLGEDPEALFGDEPPPEEEAPSDEIAAPMDTGADAPQEDVQLTPRQQRIKDLKEKLGAP